MPRQNRENVTVEHAIAPKFRYPRFCRIRGGDGSPHPIIFEGRNLPQQAIYHWKEEKYASAQSMVEKNFLHPEITIPLPPGKIMVRQFNDLLGLNLRYL